MYERRASHEREIDIFGLIGDGIARGLGLNVEVSRIALTAVAALMTASSVNVVGLLGFVGLIVPHAARLLVDSDFSIFFPPLPYWESRLLH